MSVEVRIPPLGESIAEGVISRWLKQDGDAVQLDEPILELETDKAAMEIGASAAGRLEIVAPQGSTVQVGAVVARITEGGDGRDSAAAKAAKPKEAAVREPGTKEPPAKDPPRREAPVDEPPADPPPVSDQPVREAPAEGAHGGDAAAEPVALAPAVRRLVEEHDLDPRAIRGTGKGGRITKEDVLRHLERSENQDPPRETPAAAAKPPDRPAEAAAPPPAPVSPQPEDRPPVAAPSRSTSESDVERVPMTLLRRRIAERLVQAQHTAAILTTFNEIDMSAVIDLRRRYKERFEKTHGVGLGFVSIFARAVVLALREM
ncbi:MAG: hypothetical protein QOD06_3445, partial [Candidatus Binatota bacterium]|nr:hypothetical protein [Candidatus Binatota bacterium]